MVISKGATTGVWKWGDKELPTVAINGSWDSPVLKVISNGKKKLNQVFK